MAQRRAVGGSAGGRNAAAALLLPPLLVLLLLAGLASAGLHVVGDKQQWRDGVNYSEWAARSHFYAQDWLGEAPILRCHTLILISKLSERSHLLFFV